MKCHFAILCYFRLIYLLTCAAQNRFTSILNRFKCGSVPCDDLVVQTEHGKLQGRAYESVLTKTEYYAFLGVPYARPPLGELRFQVSSPVRKWINFYLR